MGDVQTTEKKVVNRTKRKDIDLKASPSNILFQLAADRDFPVDKLEKLIELKNQEEDRAARREFDLHFAEMQGEFPTLPRPGKNPKFNSTYCPYPVMVRLCRPTITKHGFSYSYDEMEIPQEPGAFFITITVSGWGWERKHTKKGYVESRTSRSGNEICNRNQESGSMDTYVYRALFKAAFGVAEDGEDDDGNASLPLDGDKKTTTQKANTATTKPVNKSPFSVPDAPVSDLDRSTIMGMIDGDEKTAFQKALMAGGKGKTEPLWRAKREECRKRLEVAEPETVSGVVEDGAEAAFDAPLKEKKMTTAEKFADSAANATPEQKDIF